VDHNDRKAIEDLFGKLAAIERQTPARDAEAEAYIHNTVARQPSAAYYMAQTVIMQEQALNAAQQRIEALEGGRGDAVPEQQRGGFLSRLTGGGAGVSAVPRVSRQAPATSASPFHNRQGGGGGFLAGAAQTALGVAGGVLLGNAIGGMFAGDAQAGEPAADEGWNEEDPGTYDDGGFDEGE